MPGYDFYDTEIQGIALLREGEVLEIHVRDRDTMESRAVRAMVSTSQDRLDGAEKLFTYGRLGVAIPSNWYIQILEELGDESLATSSEEAARLDPEMQAKEFESFKKGRRMVKS